MIQAFLLDEHLPRYWRRALVKRGVVNRIAYVGDPDAPPLRSPDPVLLHWCEEHQAALITNNRATMSEHLKDHQAAGRNVPGIFTVDPRTISMDDLAFSMNLITGASFEGEYQDHINFLPMV